MNILSDNNLTTNEQFKFSSTGLQVVGHPTFEQWQETGQYLKYVESAIQWWIGDWLNYGDIRWGDMYTQAIEESDYAKGTLQNIKYVTGKIESSQRNENLSYSHHVEVASLDPPLQSELLNLAEEDILTVRELRQKVKKAKGDDEPSGANYLRLTSQVISSLDVLMENYPSGIDAIRLYLDK